MYQINYHYKFLCITASMYCCLQLDYKINSKKWKINARICINEKLNA